jgi:hypothetical protein
MLAYYHVAFGAGPCAGGEVSSARAVVLHPQVYCPYSAEVGNVGVAAHIQQDVRGLEVAVHEGWENG